ncbi:TMV resistance protein N-like [Prunus avium]|uniref:TMV resistance protein N-like n=1 Tax=Prunus avium TaxID=42229 RepID=A0A6P5SFE7_PRUAV|nr:TMV resistance protein N-like [Prunus avium]
MIPQADISSLSSSSSSPTPLWMYDVFLSFRGKDTRTGFTDHLYAALIRKGIITFRDDEKLKKGKSISKLFNAIEQSRYVVAILSSNYGDSTWCLEELAKAVECKELMGQTLIPIFFHVHPSEVGNQTGSFEIAFSKNEQAFKGNLEKVERWRAALSQAAGLSRYHYLHNGYTKLTILQVFLVATFCRYESELIQTVVRNISTELCQTMPSAFTDLVGMDSRVKEMLSYLVIRLNKVRMIGIWGMGGMGKTTIAHVVSERIRAQFEAYSFLSNVREVTEKQGVVHLQKKLLSDILLESSVSIHNTYTGISIIRRRLCTKKVLIILDDVDRLEQLRALSGHNWFGPGSRIIITSRDKRVLIEHGVDKIYQVKPLTNNEALQLFNWKSFRSDQVGEEFLELSKSFVKYANGLPLAIENLGTSLFQRSLEEWPGALFRLKERPDKITFDVLKVSFDGLQEIEKKIFLDIAFFFKGEDKYRVTRILECCYGHCPVIHIKVLMEKCLLTPFGRKLWMHDLIQKLGWEIVRQENPEAGKRSRLWLPNDIIPVLVNNTGMTAVQGVYLNFQKNEEINLSVNDPFSEMKNLRLLKIWNGDFFGKANYLSNQLALLEWHECPLNYLPSEFESDKLVELKMHSSRIKQLWTGDNFLLRVFQYFFNGVHVVAANSGNFLNLGVVAAAIDDHFDEAEGGFRTEGEEGVSGVPGIMSRMWIQNPNRCADEYLDGIEDFIHFARSHNPGETRIWCPCRRCNNMLWETIETVRFHLVRNGMIETYSTWNHHGEQLDIGLSSRATRVDNVEPIVDPNEQVMDIILIVDNLPCFSICIDE